MYAVPLALPVDRPLAVCTAGGWFANVAVAVCTGGGARTARLDRIALLSSSREVLEGGGQARFFADAAAGGAVDAIDCGAIAATKHALVCIRVVSCLCFYLLLGVDNATFNPIIKASILLATATVRLRFGLLRVCLECRQQRHVCNHASTFAPEWGDHPHRERSM